MFSKSKSNARISALVAEHRKISTDFAAMGKHCEGLEEPDPDSDGATDETWPVKE